MMKYSDSDTQLLESLLKIGRQIESEEMQRSLTELGSAPDSIDKSEHLLLRFVALLSNTQFSNDENIQRLSRISDHLHPRMNLKQFLVFLVPIERLLNQSLRDDQFVITKNDRLNQESPQKSIKRPLVFVLDHLRSAFNVGNIFRLADALGAQEIHLVGYTATPENSSVKKSALGSTEAVEWKSFPRIKDSIDELKNRGFQIFALETSENSNDLLNVDLAGPVCFVVGNERFGLDVEALQFADQVCALPMSGRKNSLNVANCLSVAGYMWLKQNPSS